MNSHLVTIEVGVEGRTHERVQLDSITFNQTRPECLNTLTVKRRCTVKKHVLAGNCLFENLPYLWYTVFDQAACTTDVEGELAREKTLDDEWAEEFKHHVLWKPAFIERQIRSHDDN